MTNNSHRGLQSLVAQLPLDSLAHREVDGLTILQETGGAHLKYAIGIDPDLDLDLLSSTVFSRLDISDLKQSDVSVRVGDVVDILSG